MNPKTFTAFFAAFFVLTVSFAFSSEKNLIPIIAETESNTIQGKLIEISLYSVVREELTDLEVERSKVPATTVDKEQGIYGFERDAIKRLVVHLKPIDSTQVLKVVVAIDGKLHEDISSTESAMPRKYQATSEWKEYFELDSRNNGGEFVVFPEQIGLTRLQSLYKADQGIFIGVTPIIKCKCPFPQHHQPKALTEWFLLKPAQ